MKRLLITFSTVLVILLCLTIGIGASDIYSDYTKEGVNGEAPLFTFLGYSLDPNSSNICVNYNVDLDAVEAYENQINKTVNYGVVAAHKSSFNGTTPLDSNGKPTGENADKILTLKLDKRTAILSVILTGIESTKQAEEFLLCMYVVEEAGVKYVAEKTTETAPDPVSYEKIRGPIEVVYEEGNDTIVYSYEKPENTMANDRNKQMIKSEAEYGTPVIDANTYTSSKMSSVLSGAKTIAGNGFLGMIVKGVYPNASSFMAHYLKNTGEDKTIDMGTGTNGFFKSGAGTIAHRDARVNQALRAAETLAREGQSVSIYQQMEIVNHFGGTEDWYLAVGSYFTCIEMHNVTVTVNADGTRTYSAQLTYKVADYYNWNENSWSTIPIVDVSQRDLHQLHRTKQAKEFESTGSKTYSLTWTEGQDASTLSYK